MIIVWHYRDLRLEDHPALSYAARSGKEVLPLYIHDTESEGEWAIGGASRWWLHHSLKDLEKRYQQAGSSLVVRKGEAKTVLQQLIERHHVSEVCWLNRYQPALLKRDDEILRWLEKEDVAVNTFEGNYLVSPAQVLNKSDKPYVVYTPFSKALFAMADWGVPLPAPAFSSTPKVKSETIESLELLPTIPWDRHFPDWWKPGREGALDKLDRFVVERLQGYGKQRDFVAEEGTSRLSPHLAFGEVSPREVWTVCEEEEQSHPYLRQLLWREFGNTFLYHFPNSTHASWKEPFAKFPWDDHPKALKQWQKGETGYPIVDAAMRQLWTTGWMHNRTRMIVASFLVKDLMIHWVEGARWFWDTLVDADLANNTLGWQWTAGSGPDAAPYFRIFNPVLQGEKIDPDGEYVRQYVPELHDVPTRWIHKPWEAPGLLLKEAGVTLGVDYPHPLVDHKVAREQALAAYQKIK